MLKKMNELIGRIEFHPEDSSLLGSGENLDTLTKSVIFDNISMSCTRLD